MVQGARSRAGRVNLNQREETRERRVFAYYDVRGVPRVFRTRSSTFAHTALNSIYLVVKGGAGGHAKEGMREKR